MSIARLKPDFSRSFMVIFGTALRISLAAYALGLRPAGAETLKPDEDVILFPALAKRGAGGWKFEVHGIVYEPGQHRLMTGALRRFVGIDEGDLTDDEKRIFTERCRYFLVDNERGKKFAVSIGGEEFRLGASEANGHFRGPAFLKTNTLPLEAANGVMTLHASVDARSKRSFPLELHLVEDTGWSVISDIDDTIKISEVGDKDALLRNTFCRPFKSVPGMSEVYRGWATSRNARFHYVTASPWQLYLPLSEFTRASGFPAGTFQMEQFRAKDPSVFSLFASPERYKPGAIEPLFRQFPKRRFVLVGDSGEKDPEIYGALARKFPNQVLRIYIRDVTAENANAARYRRAFEGVKREVWSIFKEPKEIEGGLAD